MKTNIITPLEQYEPVIGSRLWSMQDTRRRTKEAIVELDNRSLNWVDAASANSIGSLLYHIAAIEMDWLYADVLELPGFPTEIEALLQYDVRDQDGRLTAVEGETLDMHLRRLDVTRRAFLSAFEGMSLTDFRRPRQFQAYEVTPEWVIHHLIQHEAEHRGQIMQLRALAEQTV